MHWKLLKRGFRHPLNKYIWLFFTVEYGKSLWVESNIYFLASFKINVTISLSALYYWLYQEDYLWTKKMYWFLFFINISIICEIRSTLWLLQTCNTATSWYLKFQLSKTISRVLVWPVTFNNHSVTKPQNIISCVYQKT